MTHETEGSSKAEQSTSVGVVATKYALWVIGSHFGAYWMSISAVWLIIIPLLLLEARASAMSVPRPKLVAFDLDGTVWSPDMYMLWGGGAPFEVKDPTKNLIDCSGQEVRLLGEIGKILEELATTEEWKGTVISWVSCTDEPSWANECLMKFVTPGKGIPLKSLVPDKAEMIFKSSKKEHFKRLKAAYPEIEYSEMIFFDNEMGNIRTCTQAGVLSIHCPDGMTRDIWDIGLASFAKRS